jgi:hypothetical protein
MAQSKEGTRVKKTKQGKMVSTQKPATKVVVQVVQQKVNTTKRNIVGKVDDKSVENRTKSYH